MAFRRFEPTSIAIAGLLAGSLVGCIDEPDRATAPTPPFGVLDSDEDRFENPAVSQEDFRTQVEANTTFAGHLYAEVAANRPDASFVASPHTVSLAAVKLHIGAGNPTDEEIASALEFELEADSLYPFFNRLERTVARQPSTPSGSGRSFDVRSVDNRWLQRGSSVRLPYLRTLTRQFDAPVYTLDIAGDAARARTVINRWVADQTIGGVGGPLPDGEPSTDSQLVITTATAPRGTWAFPFDQERTETTAFRRLDGSTVDVDTMRLDRTEGLRYGEGANYRSVAIPYVGRDAELIIIVPDEGSFADVEAEVSGTWLREVMAGLAGGPVALALPRFEASERLDLRPIIQELGAPSLFDPASANLTGISSDPDLAVGGFFGQTRLSVDEQGSDAGVGAEPAAVDQLPPDAPSLTADRPFLVVLHHEPTGQILVIGRVLEP